MDEKEELQVGGWVRVHGWHGKWQEWGAGPVGFTATGEDCTPLRSASGRRTAGIAPQEQRAVPIKHKPIAPSNQCRCCMICTATDAQQWP